MTLAQSKRVFVGSLLLFLAVGCGKTDGNRGAVSGSVNLDGKPLEQGSILFTPIDGTKGTVTGGLIERGRYRLPRDRGPAVGRNRVEIQATQNTGKTVVDSNGAALPEILSLVAPRYNTESILKVEITPGNNTADFEVASK